MEQIIINIKDKEKAKVLFELLKALDFVTSVKTSKTKDSEVGEADQEEMFDFFALAGLWQGRDITLESIRQNAWPRQMP